MIYLKADDEATFTAALKTAGWAWDTEDDAVDVDPQLQRGQAPRRYRSEGDAGAWPYAD